MRDSSPILATIASIAVYRDSTCTPLFVPNSTSMSDPFKDVMCQAKMIAKYTLLVEAHVTGTPVGEPPEYSVRE